MKSAEEIMEILEAFDLTGSCRDAAVLAGVRITRSRIMLRRGRRAGLHRDVASGGRCSSMRSCRSWRSGSSTRVVGSARMWCTTSWPRWGMRVRNAPPAGRSRR